MPTTEYQAAAVKMLVSEGRIFWKRRDASAAQVHLTLKLQESFQAGLQSSQHPVAPVCRRDIGKMPGGEPALHC